MPNLDETAPVKMGRYQIVRPIPGGGMTEVYLVRVYGSFGIDRPLVLKALPRGHGEAAGARFLEEAAISLSLSHGNITATFETGRTEDGRAFLVMEYVHGASLRELIEQGPLPPVLAIFVAREIARALRYTHTFTDLRGKASPIAHLDVTPGNVLVSRAGHVKLTDFGIARAVDSAAGDTVFGKPAYTAPEVLSRQGGGPASDLWSLGCVLYEMMTGRAPHRGESREETIAKVRSAVPPTPPSAGLDLSAEVAGEVDRLVLSLLEPKVEDRLYDAARVERVLTGTLNKVEPLSTEADLSALMEQRFPGTSDSELRDRLRDELEAAGRVVTGAEDTESLLLERTIPLSGPEGESRADEKERSESAGGSGRTRLLLVGALFVVLLPALLILGPIGRVDEENSVAGTATEVPSEVPPSEVPPESKAPSDQALGTNEVPPESKALPSEVPGESRVESRVGVSRGPESAFEADGAIPSSVAGTDGDASAPVPQEEAGPGENDEEGMPGLQSIDPDLSPEEGTEPEPASLQINAFPYARVLLGDRELGTTPLRDVRLPPGRHRLRFVNPELGLEREMEIDLVEGEERVLGVRLDR